MTTRRSFHVLTVVGVGSVLALACGGDKPTVENATGASENTGGMTAMPNAEPTATSPVSTATPPEEMVLIPTEPEGPLAPQCGDSRLAMTEGCDDGNAVAGDGCAADCSAVEEGYVCNGSGVPCEFAELCGDSRIVGAEQCDDGNVVGADGCSASCQRERDFSCLTPGQACVSTVVCGDGRLGGAELCDDGNLLAADGCTELCALEPNWLCSTPGERCTEVCGDSVMVGRESCDDGNVTALDGCSDNCRSEVGFVCETVGAACRVAVCGDAVVEGGEPCDDGADTTLGDGCSPGCRLEPDCSLGECQSRCGDGLILAGDSEECDDGNDLAGDGCGADCLAESGFVCEVVADADVDQLELPIIYRDFRATDLGAQTLADDTMVLGHPDFEADDLTTRKGLVQTQLALPGDTVNVPYKPAYAADTAADFPEITSLASFNQWYADDPTVNRTVVDSLLLTAVDGMAGAFEFDDQTFYPLDERGFLDPLAVDATGEPLEGLNTSCDENGESGEHNFHFTSEVRYWFEYQGGEVLTFRGDDDVWVYIKGQLVVDLGGVHGADDGEILLDAVATDVAGTALDLEVGRVYEIAVFQAERHTCASSYRLTLAGFSRQRTVCEGVCGDGVVVADEQCDDGATNGQTYGGCGADCRPGPHCGDGQLDEPDEQCDNGINLDGYQSAGLENACSPGCVLPPLCGDALIDASFGEECDDGVNDGSYGGCTETCKLGPRCGDGEAQPEEECDDNNRANGDGCNVNCKDEIMRDAAPLSQHPVGVPVAR